MDKDLHKWPKLRCKFSSGYFTLKELHYSNAVTPPSLEGGREGTAYSHEICALSLSISEVWHMRGKLYPYFISEAAKSRNERGKKKEGGTGYEIGRSQSIAFLMYGAMCLLPLMHHIWRWDQAWNSGWLLPFWTVVVRIVTILLISSVIGYNNSAVWNYTTKLLVNKIVKIPCTTKDKSQP